MSTEQIMQTLLQQGEGKHLGDLCGWGLRGDHLQTDVRALAEEHGIAGDLGLPNLSPASAYRRAVNDAVRSGRNDERKFAAVKLEDTELTIVHAIVERGIIQGDSDELTKNEADFHTELKVGFDKEGYKSNYTTEALLKSVNREHPISKKIEQRYTELCVKYLPGDIRIAFQRAFEKWGAIRLLEHGGLWWVPQPSAQKVRAWKEFMAKLGNTTIVIPVFDTQETIESLREQSKSNLESQLAALLEDLESFTGKDNTRLSTLEKRIEMFDDLREKIELHARVLGNKQQQLLDTLNAAAAGLAKSLSTINP